LNVEFLVEEEKQSHRILSPGPSQPDPIIKHIAIHTLFTSSDRG
jgi:hypothetical protein